MATFDYSVFSDLATNLIAQFGVTESLTYTRVVPGDYDPSTRKTANTETTYSITAVVINAAGGKIETFDEKARSRDGMDLKATRFLVIPASKLSFIPKKGDRVTLYSEEWAVSGATEIKPGGTAIVYKVGINQ